MGFILCGDCITLHFCLYSGYIPFVIYIKIFHLIELHTSNALTQNWNVGTFKRSTVVSGSALSSQPTKKSRI